MIKECLRWAGLVECIIALNSCAIFPSMNLDHSADNGQYQISYYDLDRNYFIHHEVKMPPAYKIGVNDVLEVTLWKHPEFKFSQFNLYTKSQNVDPTDATAMANSYAIPQDGSNNEYYAVDENGKITLPLVGSVAVAGLNINDARHMLSQKLSQYFVNPQLRIKVISYNSQKVYLMGEVVRPQVVAITNSPLNLQTALTLSGGPNLNTSNVAEIYILRLNAANNVDAFRMNAENVASLLFAQSFYLKNNDIVYVSTAGLSQFNRVMQQLLPTAETIWYTKTVLPNNALPGILN